MPDVSDPRITLTSKTCQNRLNLLPKAPGCRLLLANVDDCGTRRRIRTMLWTSLLWNLSDI